MHAPTPEAGVLLSLLDGSSIEARLDAPGLDWDRLLRLAERERATPLLRRAVAGLPEALVPAGRLRQLAMLSRVVEFRLAYLQRRLVESLRVLEAERIDVVLLKGAALAATVYDGFADRPMGDADVLVPRADAVRAWRLLHDAGWTSRHTVAQGEVFRTHHHLPPLEDPNGTNVAIEIHTALAPTADAVALDAADVLDRAGHATLDGVPVRVPTPEDAVVHLAIHFAWSHMLGWAGWRTFRDLHALFARSTIDRERLRDTARDARADASLYWTFRLAATLTGFQPPPDLLASLRPARSDTALAFLERHYIAGLFDYSDFACPSQTLRRSLWTLGMTPGPLGHGGSRPWDAHGAWAHASGRAGERATVLDRVRAHLSNTRAWRRYLAAVARVGTNA